MTVLSIDNTSKNNPITTINSHTSLDTTSLNNNKIGFMFMGDYNCSKNIFFDEFYKAYKSYKDKILILQIPHHGSYKNYNNQLLDLADIFIISASTNNRYRHPHGSVLRALACSDKRYYWIKENKDNMLVIESEF
jgi:beta-lactamase superfamily II metal-dependent hydrolase